MCLMMGGGQNPLEPRVPKSAVTTSAKRWQCVLFICMVVQLVLAICVMFRSKRQGLMEMINGLFLACACFSMDHCCLMMYMVNIIIPLVTNINALGLLIQNGSWDSIYSVSRGSGKKNFAMTIMILTTIFYLTVIPLCFYAYRHWKA